MTALSLTWSFLWCYYIDNDPTTFQTLFVSEVSKQKKRIFIPLTFPVALLCTCSSFGSSFFIMVEQKYMQYFRWGLARLSHNYVDISLFKNTNKEITPSLCTWVPVCLPFCPPALAPQHQLLTCFSSFIPLAFPTQESPPRDRNSCELFFKFVTVHFASWQDAR